MKVSHYNIIIEDDMSGETSYILYNLLTRSLFRIDAELKEILEKENLKEINSSVAKILKDKGIIINKNIDELKKFKVLYANMKYNYNGPLIFTFIPTYKCNMACTYCYLGKGEKINKTMDKNVFLSSIKFIQERLKKSVSKKMIINFYGGEPLLEPEMILDSLKLFQNHLLKALISSNGTLLSKEIIKKLKKYPVAFQITLAGSPDLHDKRRFYKNGTGTFRDIINNIKILGEEGIYVNVRIDIDNENIHSIKTLLDILYKENLNQHTIFISFESIFNSYHAYNYPFCITDHSCLIDLWRITDDKGFNLSTGNSSFPFTFCLQQTNRAYIIDPYGDLYFCTGYIGNKDFSIGNISNPIEKINYSYYDWMARNPLENEKCVHCKALPLCCGGCEMKARSIFGNFQEGYCNGFNDSNFLEEYVKYMLKQYKLFRPEQELTGK